MSLYKTIEAEIKQSMLKQEKDRLLALRNIKTVLKNKAIDLKREPNDEEVLQMMSTLAKQRRESIEAFSKAGRQDLVDKEAAELKIIEAFLPAQLSPEELKKIIQDTVQTLGASGPQDTGKVMKELMPKVRGRSDGKVVSEILKTLLS